MANTYTSLHYHIIFSQSSLRDEFFSLTSDPWP
jgi:hypothetical protein